jgi:hypothetical protein
VPIPAAPSPAPEPPPVPQSSALPEVSEVPNTEVPVAEETEPARPEPGRGIGGYQHNLVRERIEAAARALGFHAARERPVQDRKKIDVALERPGQFIGCEISFETTIDHEVGNVAKCLKAGCDHVAVICGSETRLVKIEKAATACLGARDQARIGYYLPEQFLARLPELAVPESTPTTAETVRLGKYTVRRHGPQLTSEERIAREEAALRIMAERMKKRS